jgi:hypothetical protein
VRRAASRKDYALRMRFRFEHEFRGTVEAYWRAFFDDALTRDQYERLGVRELEVVERREDDEALARTLRVVPARELPAVLRRLTGASLGYTETTVLDRRAGVATTTVVPDTLADRITIGGRHVVTSPSPGAIVRTFEGSVEVRVAVIGGRIERAIVEDMRRSYAASAAMTQAALGA